MSSCTICITYITHKAVSSVSTNSLSSTQIYIASETHRLILHEYLSACTRMGDILDGGLLAYLGGILINVVFMHAGFGTRRRR